MNKITLTKKIKKGHADIEELLSQLSDEQLLQAGTIGSWSVKDTLAHIVIHEQRMLKWMRTRLAGVNPVEYQPLAMPEAELNALNERIYQENRAWQWQDVYQFWQMTHEQTLAFVKSVGEEELANPEVYCLKDGEALWEAVAANTYEHCAEHGSQIRERFGLPR